jgi:hypothetical protein
MWRSSQGVTQRTHTIPRDSVSAYLDAVERFRKAAATLSQHADLLARAQEAYEETRRASAELQNALKIEDENLRQSMINLEQAATTVATVFQKEKLSNKEIV